METLKEHYVTLGLTGFASVEAITQEDIRTAYRQLARTLHPDKNLDDPNATAKFQKLTHAYEILSDPMKRSVYDGYGDEGVRQHAQSGDFANLFNHPWLLHRFRWLAFVLFWAFFSMLNYVTHWPVDWLLVAGACSYLGPLSTFLYNFSARLFHDLFGRERKRLAMYFAVSSLLLLSFVVYHLLPTRALLWGADALVCTSLLLLLNQASQNWDMTLGLAVAALAIDPKLRTMSLSKYSHLLGAYVFLNGLVVLGFMVIFLTLPRPVQRKRSYVAVPLFRVVGRVALRLLRTQHDWNWLLLGVWIAVLIFDHFFTQNRWIPRLEHILPVLKHLVIDGLHGIVLLKNVHRPKRVSWFGRQCVAILMPFVLSRYICSAGGMVMLASMMLCLCIARLAYMVTVNAGSAGSAVSRWWASVFLAGIAFGIEWYSRGFTAVPWQRTASFAMGCYVLIFVELWQVSPGQFAKTFADDDQQPGDGGDGGGGDEKESTSPGRGGPRRRKHRK